MAFRIANSRKDVPDSNRVPCSTASVCAHAEGIDTEHLFGFMIGTDVGNVGEREFQSQTTGRFGKDGGRYRAVGQEFELEFVPVKNFRVEIGSAFAGHDIRARSGP